MTSALCNSNPLVVVVPLGFLVAARHRAVAPVVALGVLVGALDAAGFALGYLGSEGALTPVSQVLVNYKDAPAGLTIVYVCLAQVRRYRVARNSDRLRKWFERAPYVVGTAFFVGLVGELIITPPVLESEKGLPVVAFLLESARYVSFAVYAAAASLVFFEAVGGASGLPVANQRLQNLFAGVALVGLAGLPLHTLAWRGFRTLLPEERIAPLAERLGGQQVLLIALIAGSISAALFSYFRQSRSSRSTERLLNFLDLVGDLTEELAHVHVSSRALCSQHACMHEAAGEGFLDLCKRDRRRMDIAFRMKVLFEHRAEDHVESGRTSKERLVRLAKIYDEELEDTLLTEGLKGHACGKGLPGTLQELLYLHGSGEEGDEAVPGGGLREAVALVLKTEGADEESRTPNSLAEWEQLVYVALADAGLIFGRHEDAVSLGRGISEKVSNAYELARFKIRSCADGLGPSAGALGEARNEG